MMRPSPRRTTVDALGLRAWATSILLTDEPPVPPPVVAAEAWELFAEMEWVSQPLRIRLRGAGVWDACDAGARGALDRAADLELARIEGARAELQRIGALAVERGWTVIVMKGGVAVAEGADIHLADLDLLALAPDAEALIEALQCRGDAGIVTAREHRFEPWAVEGIGIEVHRAVRGLGDTAAVVANAFPLSRHPGLWRLPPQAHLWHVLYHSVVRHPDRIARLRDVLVLRRALAACTDDEVRAVHERIAGESLAGLLRGVLRMAAEAETAPATEACVRQRYHLLGRWRWMGSVKVGRAELRQILEISTALSGARSPSVVRPHLFGRAHGDSRSAALTRIGTHLPSAERGLRIAIRGGRVAIALLLAGLAAVESRTPLPAPVP